MIIIIKGLYFGALLQYDLEPNLDGQPEKAYYSSSLNFHIFVFKISNEVHDQGNSRVVRVL